MQEKKKLCVISMSGGLDSTTLAMKALEDQFIILPVNIKYGQKNDVERKAFNEIFNFLKRNYPDQMLDPIELDLEGMLNTTLGLYKKLRDTGVVNKKTRQEFYTPSRNLVFSTLASMIGEVATMAMDIPVLYVGLGIHKHSDIYARDYWDITPDFAERLSSLLALNDNLDVRLYAPYASQMKSEIVNDVKRLGVPYEKTWTCYNPVVSAKINKVVYKPCLKCEACLERQKAGDDAGLPGINNYGISIDAE